ncbi:hypothetical protein [Winogradskya humida]|uniref:hypothetical protein n=1 Tax=Winogradskya humida TaxID=113566 RepID=UPI00194295A4|nr:hypothetical protein [Actinoplanes humidus]
MNNLNPTTTALPATDLYDSTLSDLRIRILALSELLDGAQSQRGPIRRRSALGQLHTQIRGMAAVANHALGGWPDSPDPQ